MVVRSEIHLSHAAVVVERYSGGEDGDESGVGG